MIAGEVFRFLRIADIHVWTIISDPALDPSKVLIVNFSTSRPHLDQACQLAAGEHDFITCQTIVEYGRSKITTDQMLEQLRAAGRMEFFAPLSPQLLEKIRRCAMNSTRMPLEHADILVEQELIE